jgi:hypothetical protein
VGQQVVTKAQADGSNYAQCYVIGTNAY